VAVRNYSNTAVVTTETGLATGAGTSLTLASATGWPAAPFTAVVEPGTANAEVILVGARTTTACTAITRGYDGTAAVTHASGSVIAHEAVAQDLREANQPDELYAYRAAAATIPASAANLLIAWDTEVKDSAGTWTPASGLVFPEDGLYWVMASTGWPVFATTVLVVAEWRKNAAGAVGSGTRVALHSQLAPNAAFNLQSNFVIPVVAGDTLECWVRQSSGASGALGVGQQTTFAHLLRVSN
jgi:hypothetical protein